jgi:hypothetical protein
MFSALLVCGLGLGCCVGCSETTKQETREAVDQTGEAIRSAAEDTKENVQKAAEKVEEGARNVRDSLSGGDASDETPATPTTENPPG